MQVILMERIEKLGLMGDVVTVKPGYARNYLLPQGKARRATQKNLDLFEQQRGQLEAENLDRRDEAEKIGDRLRGLEVTLIRQAGESGQLYGSVTTRDLAEAITEAGFTIARDQVVLDAVIKATGVHRVVIRLHPEVSVAISANVARSDAEAGGQSGAGHVISAEEQHTAEEAAAADREAALAQIEADEAAKAATADAKDSKKADEGAAQQTESDGSSKAKDGL